MAHAIENHHAASHRQRPKGGHAYRSERHSKKEPIKFRKAAGGDQRPEGGHARIDPRRGNGGQRDGETPCHSHPTRYGASVKVEEDGSEEPEGEVSRNPSH